jgi:outer membrane lipoprotein SlyB
MEEAMRGCAGWIAKAVAAGLTVALIAGCGGPVSRRMQPAPAPAGATYGEAEVRSGRIERIDPVELEGDHQLGVGHVLGAVAGGAMGHQFGGGKAKVVAQVVGSVSGGSVGGGIQRKYAAPRDGQLVTVTLGNGVAVGIVQPANPALRAGDCVRIDGSGQSARVVSAPCTGAPPPDARPTGERLAAQFGPQGESARARIQARMREPATTAPVAAPASEAALRMGRIESVEAVEIADADDLGLHQMSNGVAGDAMGYRLPGGASREFADAARVLGGSGAAPPAPFAGPRPGQYVLVRLDNGIVVGIAQPPGETLQVGDRVRVDGAGSAARVVRA